MNDPCSLKEAEEVLNLFGPVAVTYEQIGLVDSWFVGWKHGSMSLQNSNEPMARCTAALFCLLYTQGIPAPIARDLACSYFDLRIGRKIVA